MLPPDLIDRRRLADTFVGLIRIDSPSFREQAIGERLAALLEQTGCAVERQEYDSSFNLIGRKKGNSADALPLLVCGHMDTIEPTEGIEFSVDEEMIRSTGKTVLGADDKSALAQTLEALTVIREHDLPHGDLEIVFTSAEERSLLGSKNLDFSRIRSKQALVLDASAEMGSLVVSAPTHITYEMRVTGRPAHAGIEPEAGISAIRAAAQIVCSVPDGRISEQTTANIGEIRGGTETNVVPEQVVIRGEFRSRSEEELEALRDRIFGAAHSIAASRGVEVAIAPLEDYRAFTIPEGDPFLQFLCGVFRKCGREPLLVPTGGGSDANVFNRRGIRAVNMANGMRRVHSSDEHIYLADLYEGCRLLLQAITDFRGFAGKSSAPSRGTGHACE